MRALRPRREEHLKTLAEDLILNPFATIIPSSLSRPSLTYDKNGMKLEVGNKFGDYLIKMCADRKFRRTTEGLLDQWRKLDLPLVLCDFLEREYRDDISDVFGNLSDHCLKIEVAHTRLALHFTKALPKQLTLIHKHVFQ
jgi:hypothetical protein